MASEIGGLPALRGYLKLGNLVVRLGFPYEVLPAKCPPLVKRPRSPLGPDFGTAKTSPEAVPESTASAERAHTPRGQHPRDLSID
jgi:hypothetical protein